MGDEPSTDITIKNISYHLLLPIVCGHDYTGIDPFYVRNIYLFRDIEDFNRYITLGIIDGIYITMTFINDPVDVWSYYTTDVDLLNNIRLILESKYSQVSKEFKDTVLKYLIDRNLTITKNGMINPVICILEPEDYMEPVSKILDVDVELLKVVGELGNRLCLTNEIMDKEVKKSISTTAEYTIITKVILESEKTKLNVSIKGNVVEATFIASESVGLDYDLYKVHIRKNTPIVFPEGSEEDKSVTEFVSEGGYLLISPSNVIEILK